MAKKNNILIDLMHVAHLNFFRNAIKILSSQGYNITLLVLKRGKLPDIIRKELPGYKQVLIGKHRGTGYSIIVEANLLRFIRMFFFTLIRKVDIGLSVGSFILGMVLKIQLRNNIQFDDDPERKINVKLERLTATRLFFPPVIPQKGKIEIFNALKEWAYLSPKYFTADKSVIKKMDLEPNSYIFVREVSLGTLNYIHQVENILSVSKDFPDNLKVVLSLEDKRLKDQYPKDWVILEEPVEDIHSIIYYSSIVISSGDSMAREGAMLGNPSVYCGFRQMKANEMLIQKGKLYHLTPKEVPLFIQKNLKQGKSQESQVEFREKLEKEWADVTELIIKQVKLLLGH